MKKKLLTLIVMIMAAFCAFAQNPAQLTYQSVVRDNNNHLVVNSLVDVKITIQKGNPASQTFYSELHANVLTNQNGLVTLIVGAGVPVSPYTAADFSTVEWVGAYIKTEITYDGHTAVAVTPVTAMPYALDIAPTSPTLVNNYLTINGLCDSIKNNCNSVAFQDEPNTFIDNNTFKDTVYVEKGAVQADGSIATTDSLRAVNATDLVNYTSNAIHDSIVNNISSQIQDSINNHLAEYGIQDCEDVTDCVVSALEDGTSDINHRVDTIAENVTLTELRDGNSDINHTVDTIAEKVTLTELQDGTSDVNHTVDTIVEHHLLPYVIQDCEDVTDCVDAALRNDGSQTNTIVDSIIDTRISKAAADSLMTLTEVQNTIHDSIVNNIANQIHDSIAANALDCDDIAECIITNDDAKENIIKIVSDTLSNGNSELNHRVDTIAENVTLTELQDGTSEINHTVDTIVGNIIHDSIVNNIANQIHDSIINSLDDYEIRNCADVMACGGIQTMRDSIQHNHDSIVTLSQNLADTIKYYINGAAADSLMTLTEVQNTIHDSIVSNIADQIHDSIAANALECSDIAECVVSEIQNNNADLIKVIDSVTYQNTLDSIQKATSELNHAIDTIVENHLGDYKIQDCEDVTDCVDAALRTESSQTNTIVDSIIDTRISKAAADSLMTLTEVQNTIHDSIVNNIANQIHDSIAAITLDCDEVAACIISNEDAKENIIKIVSDTLTNGNSELNHIIDTIAGASQVNADWNATSGKAQILNKPTIPTIPADNTTLTNLCDQIASAACPSIAYLANDNTFTGENTFNDNTTFSDTVVVPDVINADSTFSSGDASQAVNALDVQKYVAKATSEKQTSFKVASAAAGQTAFTLTIPTGYASVNSDTRLVQLYINGVYVGDNVDGVVNVSGTAVTYVPAQNDGYVLVAGDRIQIVYWVKK